LIERAWISGISGASAAFTCSATNKQAVKCLASNAGHAIATLWGTAVKSRLSCSRLAGCCRGSGAAASQGHVSQQARQLAQQRHWVAGWHAAACQAAQQQLNGGPYPAARSGLTSLCRSSSRLPSNCGDTTCTSKLVPQLHRGGESSGHQRCRQGATQ